MMRRRGLELAASILVTLIVSIIVLGLAGGITWQLFCGANERVDAIDAQAQKYIEQRLTSGAAVQAPDASKTAKAPASFCGGRAPASAVFGLGVRNDGNTRATFMLVCTYDGVEKAETFTQVGQDCAGGAWRAQYASTMELDARERDTLLMVFNVPSGISSGRHTFTVRAFDEASPSTLYGAAKLYLTVE